MSSPRSPSPCDGLSNFPLRGWRCRRTFVEVSEDGDSCPPDSPSARSAPDVWSNWEDQAEPHGATLSGARLSNALPCSGPFEDKSVHEEGQDTTIKSIFMAVRHEDPRRLLVVRRINKLGFESKELLTSHFSRFGQVVRVLVKDSRAKKHRNRGTTVPQMRMRPGGMGIVVMRDAECAEVILGILRAGGELRVSGVPVQVEPFDPGLYRMMCASSASQTEDSPTTSPAIQGSIKLRCPRYGGGGRGGAASPTVVVDC